MAVADILARARVLADLGRNAEAEPLLAQALAQDPDNEDGLALYSRVLVTGHPETARKALRVLPQAVDFLREVPAAPDSEFAAAVQGLGVLLESHGLMTLDARGA